MKINTEGDYPQVAFSTESMPGVNVTISAKSLDAGDYPRHAPEPLPFKADVGAVRPDRATVKPSVSGRVCFDLNGIRYDMQPTFTLSQMSGRLDFTDRYLRRLTDEGETQYAKEPTQAAHSHAYKIAEEMKEYLNANLEEIHRIASAHSLAECRRNASDMRCAADMWDELAEDIIKNHLV